MILVSEIGPDHRPAPIVGSRLLEFGDQSFVLDESAGSLTSLNPSGALLWQLFDGHATIREVAADVAEVFDISTERAESDVLSLVESLGQRGLLQDVMLTEPAHVSLDSPDDECEEPPDSVDAVDPFDDPRYLKVPLSP